MLYLPMILNICVLAYATRFEGTRITTLMLLANIFLLCWDYDRLKIIVAGKSSAAGFQKPVNAAASKKFPFLFSGFVLVVVALVIIINQYIFEIRPGNSQLECNNGCAGNKYPAAARKFCDCIYNNGYPLDTCLEVYDKAKLSEPAKP